MSDFAAVKERARQLITGRTFEQFHEGQRFEHHWGRTLTAADSMQFAALTLSYTPQYFDREFALGQNHRDLVVHPMLVFLTVFGMSVEDLSEGGGPFLGVDDLAHHRPVIVGETVRARSTTIAARTSSSRPGLGIVTWHTEGVIDDEVVVDFRRTNLVRTTTGGAVL